MVAQPWDYTKTIGLCALNGRIYGMWIISQFKQSCTRTSLSAEIYEVMESREPVKFRFLTFKMRIWIAAS